MRCGTEWRQNRSGRDLSTIPIPHQDTEKEALPTRRASVKCGAKGVHAANYNLFVASGTNSPRGCSGRGGALSLLSPPAHWLCNPHFKGFACNYGRLAIALVIALLLHFIRYCPQFMGPAL
jgi:hypothetical protein